MPNKKSVKNLNQNPQKVSPRLRRFIRTVAIKQVLDTHKQWCALSQPSRFPVINPNGNTAVLWTQTTNMQEESEEQTSPTHITPPINPTLTKRKGIMTERMGYLFDTGSLESKLEGPELSNHDKSLKPSIKQRWEEFERVGMENIPTTHHLRIAKEAIKLGKPPKGLTRSLTLTAYLETKELNTAVKEEMAKAGLAVCCLLRDHYAAIHKHNLVNCR